MKKLINAAAQVVPESLEGLARLHSGLVLLEDENAVLRADLDEVLQRGEVALVSGGGAGHEPAHAGFIGPGLLTAAVCGEVFASPGVDAILATIRAVTGPGGVLLIVKNYTGDRLNFGLAAELARSEGAKVRTVVVADDVSIGNADDTAGRRGLAGTLLVHKVAGAAAAAGLPLDEVAALAQAAADNVRTMGVGLSACTLPAAGRSGFELGPNEIELGLGIHGEAGVRRVPLLPADELVDRLLDRIVSDMGLSSSARVALLVNGLGATPAMELGIVARRALATLATSGIKVERALCGTYMTALDMEGCSLSLMLVDDERLALLDAPAQSFAWPAQLLSPGAAGAVDRPRQVLGKPMACRISKVGERPFPGLREGIHAAANSLLEAEAQLTELDRVVGDGDLGTSMARGVDAILRDLQSYALSDPAATFSALAATVRRAVGGTSGPLYAVGLLRCAQVLETRDARNPMSWVQALESACEGITKTGGAALGDRTMLDALIPAANAMRRTLQRSGDSAAALSAAVEAARQGAEGTAALVPRRGRSSYLGERVMGHPDPGAKAVWIWLQAIRQAKARLAEPVG